jgi:hypothetical protein
VLVAVLTLLSASQLSPVLALHRRTACKRSVAEAIKVGLTESMINGTIGKRQQFLARLAGVPGRASAYR